ncbi:prolyl-tRNA synthetase [compost metagenome]
MEPCNFTLNKDKIKRKEDTMSFVKVKQYFGEFNLSHRVVELEQTSATVEQAAMAIGCAPALIAKTMSFLLNDKAILIVTAGDAKIDNKKYKEYFREKAKMIPGEQVEVFVGHAPGGVCPFAINKDVNVFLDVSLKRFETIFPAAGSANSAVRLSLKELEVYSSALCWVDVSKGWFVN